MRDDVKGWNVGNDYGRLDIEAEPRGSLLDWGAIAVGVVVTYISLAVLVGAGAFLVVSGFGSGLMRVDGARGIALVTAVSLIAAVAIGAWWGAWLSIPTGITLLGPIVASIVILISVLVAGPIVNDLADFRNVAIALGIVDAPNVGTRVSEALHRLVQSQRERTGPAGENVVGAAWMNVRATAWYVAAVLAALILAGGFGAALGRQPRSNGVAPRLAAAGLAGLGWGIAILTVTQWSSIWSVTTALVDFDQSAGPEIGVVMSEVARHPEVMWGRTVTISARIESRLNDHAIMLGNDKPLVGDMLLVVSEKELNNLALVVEGANADLEAGDVVQVTGVVRRYDPARLESELGIQLDRTVIDGYASQAVLVATAIDVDVPVAAAAGDKEFGSGSSGYDLGVTIDDILAQPEALLGMTVTVSDEVEEHLLTPHAFLLGDAAFLCISVTPRPGLFVEATAYVTGEVVFFNLAEIERRTGLDLDDEALRGYEGQPFILVDSLVVA